MSKESLGASNDELEGLEPPYFSGDCAIDIETYPNFSKRDDLEGHSNVVRLSPALQLPSANQFPHESHNGEGRAQLGGSFVKTWCSMTLMVVLSILVILFSRVYLLDILKWLERLPVVESIVLFVVLFTIVSFPFAFGYIVLNMMAGYLYGFVTGQFVVSISVTFGLLISIGLCRRYFANYGQANFTSSPFLALMRVLEGPSGLKVMALARLTPVPFGIQNALLAVSIYTGVLGCILSSASG